MSHIAFLTFSLITTTNVTPADLTFQFLDIIIYNDTINEMPCKILRILNLYFNRKYA